MTCAELHARLDDYADGVLNEADFQDVELHLAACDTCRHEEQRLRALLAQAAALPRELAPERDLWPGIEGRLQPHRAYRLGRLWPFGRRDAAGTLAWERWLMPALAAGAAALALSTFVPRAPHQPATPGGRMHALSGDAGGLNTAEAEYARASADLIEALQARRATLPPATATAVDDNLRAIDQALRDIHSALDQDPQNAQLARLLNATHRRKVAFLQQLVRLSTQL